MKQELEEWEIKAHDAQQRVILRVREAHKNCADAEADLQQVSRQTGAYQEKLEALLPALHRPLPEPGDINRTLRVLREERGESQQNLQRRKTLIEEIPQRESEIAELTVRGDACVRSKSNSFVR